MLTAGGRWSAPVEGLLDFEQALWSGIARCCSGQTRPGIRQHCSIESTLCRVGRVGLEGWPGWGLPVLRLYSHV